MIKEALEYLHGLARPEIVEVAGRPHSTRNLHPIPEPSYPEIEVHSLRGVVDYVAAAEKSQEAYMGLHIVGPREVALVSQVFGQFRQRDVFCVAKPADGDRYPFGRYMEVEEFLIALSSMFVDSDDRADILRSVGNVRAEEAQTLQDDGVSQQLTVRKGIDRAAKVVVQNPVALRPFRTFADIAQPAGLFVLRTTGGGDSKLPKVALFEVDDGGWRREAIDGIRAYFAEHLPDIPVIG